jgi:hypothetical protein
MGLFFVVFSRAHHAAIDARRRASSLGYVAWSAAAAAALVIALASLLAAAAQLWVVGLWIVAVALLAVCLTPALAPWLLRHVLVPRGWVRAAYAAGRVSAVAGTDAAGFALTAAAWAVAGGRREPAAAAAAWVRARRDARSPLGDAEVVATALLAARTLPTVARQLLRSVPELREVHPAVRELAGEWLAVDAVERGAWHELASDIGTWPATPLRFLLEGVAALRVGAAASAGHGRAALWARWLLSPYRRHTWALLRVDPQVAAPAPDAAEEPAAAAPPGTLGAAVHAHLALARPRGSAAVAVERATACWDAALAAPQTAAWLAERGAQLGAPPGSAERALREIMEAVAHELCAAVEAARLPTPPLSRSAFGQLLHTKLRHGRLDELELAFTRWAERVAAGPKLPAIEEWREFLAVRESYEALARSSGDSLRRLAFPAAFEAANRAAVVLWNQRAEYALAHAILAWELKEARHVGDVAAIEIAGKNAALRFQTRTGIVG